MIPGLPNYSKTHQVAPSVDAEQPPARFSRPRLSEVLPRDVVTFGRIATKRPMLHLSSPQALEQALLKPLRILYGSEASGIAKSLVQQISEIQKQRPEALLQQDFERPADWYKDEVIYPFYADRLGVNAQGRPNTFKDLIPMLDYLQNLGVTTLHILPFLESPMVDAGFDVSDYKNVRKNLGGNAEFDQFLAEAHKRGFKMMMDTVLNHSSDQHPWFQAALKGDPDKLRYFVGKDKLPQYKVEHSPQRGTVVVYEEKNGRGKKISSSRMLMFSDNVESHYRKETVNGKPHYFYHTFYPQQPDLNWKNPDVMREVLGVLGYWANKGMDVFRFDALPFLVKPEGTTGENTPETHAVVEILSTCLMAMAPRSVIMAEACQPPDKLRKYFGEEKEVRVQIPGYGRKHLNRSNQVQMAYDFPAMSSIWAAAVTKSPDAFWKAFKHRPIIPASATFSTFERVWDELALDTLDPATRKKVYDALAGKGEPYRTGMGVSGRLGSFLDEDSRRIALMNSILFSLPGVSVLNAGDEIGARNNPAFMKQANEARRQRIHQAGGQIKNADDSRELGRGPISAEDCRKAQEAPESYEGRNYTQTRRMIQARKQSLALRRGSMTQVKADQPSVFSYVREAGGKRVLVVHNLSDQESKVALKLPFHDRKHSSSLQDMLTGQRVAVERNSNARRLGVRLAPYESVWLKL